jgi:hypothetical protein
MQRCFVLVASLLAAAGSIPTTVSASWSEDPTVNLLVCAADGVQQTSSASAVTDGAGGVIVVWRDDRAGAPDLWAQRVSADGEALWAADGVPVCTAAGTQDEIRTVSDGAGGVIVAWRDRRGSDYDYYAQRLNGDGQVLWPTAFPDLNGTPICTADGDQEAMEAIADGAGGVIAVWRHDDPADDGIFAQRLDVEGALTWPVGTPSAIGTTVCDHDHGQFDPDLAVDGVGGVVIAWQDSRNSATTESDVYAQRLNGDGVRQWSLDGVPVCVENLGQTMPMVAADGGGAIIAWEDFRPTGQGVGAQRLSLTGFMQWPAEGVMVIETFTGGETTKAISGDGFGGAYLVWLDRRDVATTMHDIYAQRLNALGQVQWGLTAAPVTRASNHQSALDVAAVGASGLFVSWADSRAGSTDIYAQLLNEAGLPVGPADGLGVCTNASSQYAPSIVADGAGGVLVAWWDNRDVATSGADIYAHRAFSSLIFRDGFESGDTGVWGAAVP